MRTSTIHSRPWQRQILRWFTESIYICITALSHINHSWDLLILINPAPAGHLDLTWRHHSPQCPPCQSPGRRGQDSQCFPSSLISLLCCSADWLWSSVERGEERRDAQFWPLTSYPARHGLQAFKHCLKGTNQTVMTRLELWSWSTRSVSAPVKLFSSDLLHSNNDKHFHVLNYECWWNSLKTRERTLWIWYGSNYTFNILSERK